jgi:Rod binding domain-containing protein
MSVAPITSASAPLVGSPAPVAALTHAKATQLKGAALRNAAPADQRAAVGAQFEAILVRQLLGKTLTSMVGGEGGVSGSVYGDMLADTISQQLTAGPGLGLGRFLEKQLAPKGHGHGSQAEALPSASAARPLSLVSDSSSILSNHP